MMLRATSGIRSVHKHSAVDELSLEGKTGPCQRGVVDRHRGGARGGRQPADVCVTECSYVGVELPEPTRPEWSGRAVNLTSTATFISNVFVLSVDVTEAHKRDIKTHGVGSRDGRHRQVGAAARLSRWYRPRRL